MRFKSCGPSHGTVLKHHGRPSGSLLMSVGLHCVARCPCFWAGPVLGYWEADRRRARRYRGRTPRTDPLVGRGRESKGAPRRGVAGGRMVRSAGCRAHCRPDCVWFRQPSVLSDTLRSCIRPHRTGILRIPRRGNGLRGSGGWGPGVKAASGTCQLTAAVSHPAVRMVPATHQSVVCTQRIQTSAVLYSSGMRSSHGALRTCVSFLGSRD